MKLRATTDMNRYIQQALQSSLKSAITAECRLKTDKKSTTTLGVSSSSTQAPVFYHLWRSRNFTASWQGSPGADYTCLDLDSTPRGYDEDLRYHWWCSDHMSILALITIRNNCQTLHQAYILLCRQTLLRILNHLHQTTTSGVCCEIQFLPNSLILQ